MGSATIEGQPTGQNQDANPETPVVEPEAAAPEKDNRLFRFSSWVHIGPQAEECEDGENGKCGNPLHFHAWCRLPNQLQHQEIQEKALAAKARRIRQFKDPDSDACLMLDGEMDELALRGEAAKVEIIQRLLQRDFWRDLMQARRELEDEGDEDNKPWAHIEDDQKRLEELRAKHARDGTEPEGDDEYNELLKHNQAFADELEKRHKEVVKPKREAFEARDFNDLLDLYREDRIGEYAGETLVQVYNEWEWFYGTLTVPPYGERKFRSREEMLGSAPEVIEALRQVFDDLERENQSGNS